ncbi:uncharacterized protein [Ptychodera flava]|uniref:uncharacterized protein n=1 Tax=Ptychodera flava TaxID=63121 RepID=UPI003969FE02
MLKLTLYLISVELIVVQGYESFLVNEGRSVQLPCLNNLNKPIDGKLLTVKWEKNDAIFIAKKFESGVGHYVMGDRYSIDEEMKTMKIDNIKSSDEGNYTCTAEIDGEKQQILQYTVELLVNTSQPSAVGNTTNGMEKQTGDSLSRHTIYIVAAIVGGVLIIIIVVLLVVLIRRRKRLKKNSRGKTVSDQIYKSVTTNEPKGGRKARNKGGRKGYTV